MNLPKDIKPDISGPATHTSCPPPRSDGDIKPTLSEVAGIKPSRDFEKEREALKRQYDLEKRNLDLEEENRLLRATRPAAKTEPGAGEVKPDIIRLSGGSSLAPLTLGLIEDSDDEDDIVFVREIKGGRAKPSVSSRVLSVAPVKAETSQFESPITLNLEEDIPGIPFIPDRRSESNRPPPSTSNQSERPSPSLRRVRKTRVVTGKTQRTESSMTSHDSSTSESSDSSDDTWTGPSCTPVWGGPRKKGKRARRCRSDHTTSQRGFIRASTEASGRSRCPYDSGTGETDQRSSINEDGREDADPSSGEDEYTGPYKGPHLHIISVQWINDRLDRSFQKYRMTVEYLGQWAAWWPRTIVAKHHRLDPAGIWLLTVGVHKWWSDLLDELNSPDVEWPEGLNEEGQEDLTMKVEEITLAKESAMIAAKRMMLKDGEAIPMDSVLHLRHGRRKRS